MTHRHGEGPVISAELLTNMVASGAGRVVGCAGERIGKVVRVFLDEQTGRPEWMTAKAGMFSGESFIPLAGAMLNGNDIAVPFAEDEIEDAPRVKGEGEYLSEFEEARLYAYYGLNCVTSRVRGRGALRSELPELPSVRAT